MPEPVRVFLSLGSNLGDRRAQLQRAIGAIGELPATRLICSSRLIETRAWGESDQPDFLNAIVEIETALSPRELLTAAKRLEVELGRVESYRWGPRCIDIDIVAYGHLSVNEPDLIIPHRHCTEREFVLEPLREIAPDVAEGLVAGTWVKHSAEAP